MKKREPVKNIMTDKVMTVNRTTPLREVVELIKKNSFRHVPVTEGDKLVGIVSRTDLNRLTFSTLFSEQEGADEAVLEMLSLDQVMSNNPRTVSEETTIRDTAEILAKEEFHALPVVNSNGKLTGIVTTTDVIKYLIEQYD
jgi:CBS domain-containing protein